MSNMSNNGEIMAVGMVIQDDGSTTEHDGNDERSKSNDENENHSDCNEMKRLYQFHADSEQTPVTAKTSTTRNGARFHDSSGKTSREMMRRIQQGQKRKKLEEDVLQPRELAAEDNAGNTEQRNDSPAIEILPVPTFESEPTRTSTHSPAPDTPGTHDSLDSSRFDFSFSPTHEPPGTPSTPSTPSGRSTHDGNAGNAEQENDASARDSSDTREETRQNNLVESPSDGDGNAEPPGTPGTPSGRSTHDGNAGNAEQENDALARDSSGTREETRQNNLAESPSDGDGNAGNAAQGTRQTNSMPSPSDDEDEW